MIPANLLESLIESCNKCTFIDKPFIKYKVYKRFLPKKVRVLFIVESPPPGNKQNFFYNIDSWDRLRLNFSRILGIPSNNIVNLLMNKGVFITNSVKCRPPSRKYIEEMRKKCVEILDKEIKLLKPEKIVAFGKCAKTSLKELKIPATLEIPHPNYIVRFENYKIMYYRELLLKLLAT